MDERHAALDGREMRHKRHVHDFLYGGSGKHGKTGLTAAHDIRMIAEDRQRMRSQRAGADVEHARQKLAGDLGHVGNHQ